MVNTLGDLNTTKEPDLNEKTHNEKREYKYLSFSTNNVNYGVEDFLTSEEQKTLSEIIWKMWDKGVELKIGYLYKKTI